MLGTSLSGPSVLSTSLDACKTQAVRQQAAVIVIGTVLDLVLDQSDMQAKRLVLHIGIYV